MQAVYSLGPLADLVGGAGILVGLASTIKLTVDAVRARRKASKEEHRLASSLMRIGSLTALAMTGAFVYVSDLDPQFVRFGLAFPLVHAIWGLALFVCVMAGLYAANKKLLWTAAVSGFIGFGVVLFHPFPIE